MGDTTERVLRLLALLQQRPVWTGPELADRLGVTTRRVRRDVERLRALGYPVNATQGVGGGYQLGAGMALPPLLSRSASRPAAPWPGPVRPRYGHSPSWTRCCPRGCGPRSAPCTTRSRR